MSDDVLVHEDARSEPERPAPPAPRRRGSLTVSVILVVLTGLLAPLTVVAGWARAQIVDTDRWVATVGPLVDDPAVQSYLATTLTDALFDAVDVDELVGNALPPVLGPVTGTITLALEGFVRNQAEQFVQSEQFARLWESANRAAHTVVREVLTGDPDVLDIGNGAITLDVGEMLQRFQTALVERGLTVVDRIDLSNVDRQVVLLDGPQVESLERARQLLRFLTAAVWVLAVLTLVAAIASVVVAPNRRSAVMRLGIALVAATIVVAVALSIARRALLNALTDTVPESFTAALFDSVVNSLRAGFRTIFVVGALLAVLTALTRLDGFATRWARVAQVAVGGLAAVALLVRDNYDLVYVVVVLVAAAAIVVGLELARRRQLSPGL